MPSSFFDNRLVQTGVIGHKDSDRPIILPMDADELKRWRRQHPDYEYWCGTLLGGCGRQLTDRLYYTKVCHFAHHPRYSGSNYVCNRTDNGESSADHLFIKQGVSKLIKRQGLRGKVELRNLGRGPGDAVDVRLPNTRQRLRFQLADLDYRSWRRANDELGEDADSIDWIFGTDGPITQEMLSRYGYTLRVRCETDGAVRRVHIGATRPNHKVEWTPLEECVLNDRGLLTPAVEKIRLTRSSRAGAAAPPQPRPAGFVLHGGITFAVDTEAPVPQDVPFVRDGQHLVVADVKPVGSRIVRALVSLPADATPDEGHVYRFKGAVRLLVAEPGTAEDVQWIIEANAFVRLSAHEAQSTGLWSPPAAVPAPASPEPPAEPKLPGPPVTPKPEKRQETPPAREHAAAVPGDVPAPLPQQSEPAASPPPAVPAQRTPQLSAPQPPKKPEPPSPERGRLVAALRRELERAARLRTSVTWEHMARVAGVELTRLSLRDRQDLLVEVARSTIGSAAFLPVLVRTETGAPLSYVNSILSGAGRQPLSPSQLDDWYVRETRRVYAAFAGSAPVTPPSRPSVPSQLTGRGAGTASPRRDRASLKEVQDLVAYAESLLPHLNRKNRHQVAKAIKRAGRWVRELQERGVVRPEQLSGIWRKQAQEQARALHHVLTIAEQAAFGGNSKTETAPGAEGKKGAQPLPPAGGKPTASHSPVGGDSPSGRPDSRGQVSVSPVEDVSTESHDSRKQSDAEAERLAGERLDRLAEAVRDILVKTAKAQSTTTWSAIRHQLGSLLPWLHTDDQGEILVRADRETPDDEPLLSALIVVGDHVMHPLYRHVAYSLGRDVPVSDEELAGQWAMDVLKVHACWRHR
ncbi:hypothetical protein [Streptomyces sp. HB2AG]|uniref:hypothetical protein n=1 Tax=Streptomyces sp. HB2AG TaxID=2983400 RepID=UPI0022AA43E8|nr:hypothetical protein [Streptomyces sp. HB2AG]MCZ2526194.1 hypothetical protein [Streptomyces sp. HB2AG]